MHWHKIHKANTEITQEYEKIQKSKEQIKHVEKRQ